MSGLGKILSLACGMETTNPTLKEISSHIKETASIQTADEDTTSAVIRNSLHTQIADNQQDKYNENSSISAVQDQT